MGPDKGGLNSGQELDVLKRGLGLLGVGSSPATQKTFQRYLEILYAYRGRIHLISRDDYYRIALRHFLPSLMVLPYLANAKFIADIGSGAGFPSVPLKIMRPDLDFTLFESVGKKAMYLEFLVTELELQRIRICNMRAEDFARQKFDVVLGRAVGKIARLVKVFDRLLADGGCGVLFKTSRVDEEIRMAQRLMEKKALSIIVDRSVTPIENHPISIVVIKKNR